MEYFSTLEYRPFQEIVYCGGCGCVVADPGIHDPVCPGGYTNAERTGFVGSGR